MYISLGILILILLFLPWDVSLLIGGIALFFYFPTFTIILAVILLLIVGITKLTEEKQ